MKKNHVYLVVDRDYDNSQYHFFDLHDLVIATGESTDCTVSNSVAYRFIGDTGDGNNTTMGQWLLSHHVVEIGKL